MSTRKCFRASDMNRKLIKNSAAAAISIKRAHTQQNKVLFFSEPIPFDGLRSNVSLFQFKCVWQQTKTTNHRPWTSAIGCEQNRIHHIIFSSFFFFLLTACVAASIRAKHTLILCVFFCSSYVNWDMRFRALCALHFVFVSHINQQFTNTFHLQQSRTQNVVNK